MRVQRFHLLLVNMTGRSGLERVWEEKSKSKRQKREIRFRFKHR